MGNAALLEIPLVIVFGGVKLGSRGNLSDDRITMLATALKLVF